MTSSDRLIIFTRYPRAGTTKTRLIPELGPEGAAQVQRRLTERVVAEARAFVSSRVSVALEIWHEDGTAEDMSAWLGPVACRPQASGTIGQRMARAFQSAFRTGADRAVLAGSDIPGLDGAIFKDAFTALEAQPLVFGPSRDGGYYLVGMRANAAGLLLPLLFEDMVWSTDTVLAVTLERCAAAGIGVAHIPCLQDIDRPEDLDAVREQGLLP